MRAGLREFGFQEIVTILHIADSHWVAVCFSLPNTVHVYDFLRKGPYGQYDEDVQKEIRKVEEVTAVALQGTPFADVDNKWTVQWCDCPQQLDPDCGIFAAYNAVDAACKFPPAIDVADSLMRATVATYSDESPRDDNFDPKSRFVNAGDSLDFLPDEPTESVLSRSQAYLARHIYVN
jgi:hypothetical protein